MLPTMTRLGRDLARNEYPHFLSWRLRRIPTWHLAFRRPCSCYVLLVFWAAPLSCLASSRRTYACTIDVPSGYVVYDLMLRMSCGETQQTPTFEVLYWWDERPKEINVVANFKTVKVAFFHRHKKVPLLSRTRNKCNHGSAIKSPTKPIKVSPKQTTRPAAKHFLFNAKCARHRFECSSKSLRRPCRTRLLQLR